MGRLSVLIMQRDDPNAKNASKSKDDANAKKDRKKDKKWKNSVFIEFKDAHSAEKLVKDFKEGPKKPKFEGCKLESIMSKINYVTKKAIEKGLAPPEISGNPKAVDPTTSTLGALGDESCFRGKKEYVSGPFLNSKADKESKEEKALEIEYKGKTLQVNKDGSLKDVTQLKTLPEDLALGFKLKGDKPKDYKEARELESGISEGYTNFKRFFETLNGRYLMLRQFRSKTIEPILQIKEYDVDNDDDNDKERDDKNHNQESLGSELVATLKVFNVQAGSSVHTRALNNSKRFQSLEAVDKDFTPTRKGSQLDESASSNFQKKIKRGSAHPQSNL
ncbi:hypothetical protein PPACK8108_LOCUS10523 [Phakopsora pachyrhizi]|uniref:RRM domain-containing protein n=1 Tax=Phakopsora pachyrhizi TaxID=170000 RepID=A0AAV0B228_PHAPC|nr:hypothetical protein PPACK8108_LOCUS10523 [Phakopsora pachyrhizi]